MSNRRSELDRVLRTLDPADPNPTPPAELRRLREELAVRAAGPSGDELVPVGGSRRPEWLLGGGALVLAVVAVLWLAVGHQTPRLAGPASPQVAAEELLRRTTPLAVGRSVDCDGVLVPAYTLALPGGAELEDTPEAAALRKFIADNPWAGMGSVSGGNWIRLGASEDPLVFGQRRGEIGLGAVVTLVRSGESWKPTTLGGCGQVTPGPGERAAFIHEAQLDGRTLRLQWENGMGSEGGERTDRLVRVETTQDDTGLHVLIVTERNPAAPSSAWSFGVGTGTESTVSLPDGVAAPTVIIDDSGVPSRRVPVT